MLSAAMHRFAAATLVSQGPDGPIASHVPIEVIAAPAPWGLLAVIWRAPTRMPKASPGRPGTGDFQRSGRLRLAQLVPLESRPWQSRADLELRRRACPRHSRDLHRPGPFARPCRALTDRFETDQAAPWASTTRRTLIAGMLRAIIGVEISLTQVTGKWKVSQNRPAADQVGVITGLRAAGAAALADEMERARGTGDADEK